MLATTLSLPSYPSVFETCPCMIQHRPIPAANASKWYLTACIFLSATTNRITPFHSCSRQCSTSTQVSSSFCHRHINILHHLGVFFHPSVPGCRTASLLCCEASATSLSPCCFSIAVQTSQLAPEKKITTHKVDVKT